MLLQNRCPKRGESFFTREYEGKWRLIDLWLGDKLLRAANRHTLSKLIYLNIDTNKNLLNVPVFLPWVRTLLVTDASFGLCKTKINKVRFDTCHIPL